MRVRKDTVCQGKEESPPPTPPHPPTHPQKKERERERIVVVVVVVGVVVRGRCACVWGVEAGVGGGWVGGDGGSFRKDYVASSRQLKQRSKTGIISK